MLKFMNKVFRIIMNLYGKLEDWFIDNITE
jgi:hypothetical protein